MNKLFIKADVYNELIEKGYGKRDLSKLTRKVITDKNGHRRTVFVRNDVQPVARKRAKGVDDIIIDYNKNKVVDALKNVFGVDNIEIGATKGEKTTMFEVFINYDEIKNKLKNDSAEDKISKELTNIGLKPNHIVENVHDSFWFYDKHYPKRYKLVFGTSNENMKKEPKPDGDPRTGKKSYWIQDSRGNRLTNSDAKERVINNNKKIAELDKQISGMSKADAIRLNTQKHDLEYQNSYLMDRLNPEDRKEIESEKKTKSDKVTAEGFINKVKELFPNGSYDVHSPNQNELGSIGKIRASTKDIKGNEKDVKFEYIKDDTRKLSNGNSEKGVSVRIMGADYFIPETADAKRYVNNIITWNLNKELYGDSYKKHAVDYVETMAKDDTKFQSGVDYAVQYYKDNKLSGKSKEDAIKDIDYQIKNLEYKLNPDNSKDIHVSDVESNYKSLLAWKKLKKEYN